MWFLDEASAPLLFHELNEKGLVLDRAQPLRCVKANIWFAAELANMGGEGGWACCTVSPAFDFADFELANVVQATSKHPDHAALRVRLCIR